MTTYILAAERYAGWIKIGKTARETALSRMAGCQTGNPRRLRVVAAWHGDHEETLHKHYAALRGCGEWFAMPAAALAAFAAAADDERGYVRVMADWHVARILASANTPTADPEALADAFGFQRTAHEPHTRMLRSA